jgi:hypothetical protein
LKINSPLLTKSPKFISFSSKKNKKTLEHTQFKKNTKLGNDFEKDYAHNIKMLFSICLPLLSNYFPSLYFYLKNVTVWAEIWQICAFCNNTPYLYVDSLHRNVGVFKEHIIRHFYNYGVKAISFNFVINVFYLNHVLLIKELFVCNFGVMLLSPFNLFSYEWKINFMNNIKF